MVVGRWREDEVTWVAAGPRRIAVLGCAAADPRILTAALRRAHDVADLDGLLRSLPGSFHMVAAVDGTVRVQGSVSTACQIFHARLGPVTVAANRPDVLARLTGAGIAVEVLTLQMLAPAVPYPLNETPVWDGVRALPFGTCLELTAGRARERQWWTPPAPEIPLAECADRVRSVLSEAVAARTRAGGTVSADLSGGLDSTSVCFLMAAHAAGPGAPRMVTLHQESLNAGNDDLGWARHAAEAMPDAEHLVLPDKEVPPMFTGLSEPDSDAEAPLFRTHVRAMIRHSAQVLAAQGSTVHLTGDGGDELYFADPAFLHTLARRHPWSWIRKMRADRSLNRWTLTATLREIARNRPYGRWLAACADTLTDPLPKPSRNPEIEWDSTVRMPPWATPAAVEAARSLIRGAAQAAPMSPLRCSHVALRGLRKGGEAVRRTGRITEAHGISWQAPFLDDRVIEAALSIRLEDTSAVDGYKPSLTAIMRGTMPDSLLARRTKAEFSQAAYLGLHENLDELLGLCDDLRLAALDLVDADAFRAALLALYPSSMGLTVLLRTLACEVWLRSLPATAAASPIGGTA
ncbi:asparagine synthase-related protein [Actinomadura sp. 1N219]|uniref:asparagine synthase-related protein n=1 Tax=Actinomadura sp. 1N219 TaxID=3375152 RepID=UPI0037A4FA1F